VSWLNYHHLYYFHTIASEGTIAKAAAKLRLGQPTLSTQLRQLEEALGQPLFERRQKRLHLTEAGRVALDYASEIFRLGDEMQEALAGRRKGRVELAIGAMDTVPKHLVLRLAERAQAVQDCVISITEGRGDELLRELKAHRLDLLLSNYAPPVGEATGVQARRVARMPVVVCGAKRFAPLKRRFPESLDGQPFVMPTTASRLRHDVEHFLKLRKLRVDVVVEVQDTSLQKLLGNAGAGLIPVAAAAVDDLVAAKDLVVIGTLPDVHEELWLVAGERRLENPVAAQLIKSFRL
jgi:LysR family transcriptional activator of nhaA